MLVLTRKVGQTILIGGDIAIVVKGTDSCGSVKIGIVAPKDVHILRKELLARPIVLEGGTQQLTGQMA